MRKLKVSIFLGLIIMSINAYKGEAKTIEVDGQEFHIGGYIPSKTKHEGIINQVRKKIAQMFAVNHDEKKQARNQLKSGLSQVESPVFMAGFESESRALNAQISFIQQLEQMLATAKAGAARIAIAETPKKALAAPTSQGIYELPNLANYPINLIYDQGNLGSCTANSLAFALSYLSVQNSTSPNIWIGNPAMLRIARLFQYYNTRELEAQITGQNVASYVKQDVGGSMAGALMAADRYGAIPESTNDQLDVMDQPDIRGQLSFKGLPYTITSFAAEPLAICYGYALNQTLSAINKGNTFDNGQKFNSYYQVANGIQYSDLTSLIRKKYKSVVNISSQDKEAFRQSVIKSIQKSRPVYIGVMLDDSFMDGLKNRGFIPTPNFRTFRPTGGHAIVIVGYGPYNKNAPGQMYYKFMNSWGAHAGNGGYFYLEDKYVEELVIFAVEAFSVWLTPQTKVM